MWLSTVDVNVVSIPERTCPTVWENTSLVWVVSVVVVNVPPVTSAVEEDWKDPKVSVPVETGEPYQLSCQLSHTTPVTPVSSAISLIASKLLSSFTTISGLLVTSFQSSEYGTRTTWPLNGATLYGFTSKLSDAYGCSI